MYILKPLSSISESINLIYEWVVEIPVYKIVNLKHPKGGADMDFNAGVTTMALSELCSDQLIEQKNMKSCPLPN